MLREGSLARALAGSVTPYFVGISGREDVGGTLKPLSLDPKRKVRDLTAEETTVLASFLTAGLVRQGATPAAVEGVVQDRYWIEGEGIFADDLVAYVQACSRLDALSLGMALCLGDREAFGPAEDIRSRYEGQILDSLRKLEGEGPHSMKHIQFFYHENAAIAGQVAGIAMPHFLDQGKPVLALSTMDGETRVSARATKPLVALGVDLAVALREGASKVSGVGGGHNIAAGATVPKGKERNFLAAVDEVVGAQLSSDEASAPG